MGADTAGWANEQDFATARVASGVGEGSVAIQFVHLRLAHTDELEVIACRGELLRS
jgi:hypothetical protein